MSKDSSISKLLDQIKDLPFEIKEKIYFYYHPTLPLSLRNDIISYSNTIGDLKKAVMFDINHYGAVGGGDTYHMLILYTMKATKDLDFINSLAAINALMGRTIDQDITNEIRLVCKIWGKLSPTQRERFLMKLRHGFYYTDQTRAFL